MSYDRVFRTKRLGGSSPSLVSSEPFFINILRGRTAGNWNLSENPSGRGNVVGCSTFSGLACGKHRPDICGPGLLIVTVVAVGASRVLRNIRMMRRGGGMGQVVPAENLFTTAAPLPKRPRFGVNCHGVNDDQNNVSEGASRNDYASATFPHASITDVMNSHGDQVTG